MTPQLLYQYARCRGCHRCIEACPYDAISKAQNCPLVGIDRVKCRSCFSCTKVCYSRALRIVGRVMSVEEILDIVKKDSLFYLNSGGGITISGGEPLMQPHFTYNLLSAINGIGMHTAIETSGMGDFTLLQGIAEIVDTIYFDVKLLEDTKHERYTGVSNQRILSNLSMLCADTSVRKKICVHTPLIPGINDSMRDILGVISLVKSLGIRHMNVLPYNVLASEKYKWIGREYQLQGATEGTRDFLLTRARELIQYNGITLDNKKGNK